jgi:hypothetical protein
VLPGTYRIRLTARGRDLTETVQVQIDPRSHASPEALKARFEASQKLAELVKSFAEDVRAVEELDLIWTAALECVHRSAPKPRAR